MCWNLITSIAYGYKLGLGSTTASGAGVVQYTGRQTKVKKHLYRFFYGHSPKCTPLGLEKDLLVSRNSATVIHWLGLVLQLSPIQVNRTFL